MSDLSLHSIEDLINELKERNISFVIGYVDHNEFNKGKEEGIVWGLDHGGNVALQETVLRFLNEWMDKVIERKTKPGFEA